MTDAFILTFIFVLGFICGILSYYIWESHSKPKIQEEEVYPEFDGYYKVKFYLKNRTDITITNITWNEVLKIRKFIDKTQGKRGILNQNFNDTRSESLRSQVDLDEVVYVEYSRNIV